MHRCWLVNELTLEIAWHARSQSMPFLHDVAALAQTCSAIHEPVMDVLWHTLHNLLPVVKCLPDDLWYEEKKPPNLRHNVVTMLVSSE